MTRLLIPPIAALVTNFDVTDVAKVLKLPDLNTNVFISFMLQELNALKTFAISSLPDARYPLIGEPMASLENLNEPIGGMRTI